jgi:hypothetical protein
VKHIAKINGIMVFIGLLTVTNEKGEIRVCNLVATKSHSQFEMALTKMSQSLKLYGHSQPALFYTDNMADKGFLERVFPSLKDGVTPVEKHGHLPELTIPDNITLQCVNTATAIDDACRTIIHTLPDDDASTIHLGLDSEWNVNTSQSGHITGREGTAVVQLAYKDHLYVFQVRVFVEQFAVFLTHYIDRADACRALSSDISQATS